MKYFFKKTFIHRCVTRGPTWLYIMCTVLYLHEHVFIKTQVQNGVRYPGPDLPQSVEEEADVYTQLTEIHELKVSKPSDLIWTL